MVIKKTSRHYVDVFSHDFRRDLEIHVTYGSYAKLLSSLLCVGHISMSCIKFKQTARTYEIH
jgi:hypothetical protein